MGIDLEDELRQAYAHLPADRADHAEVMLRSQHIARRMRRRRTTGICAGAVAAALVVGGAAVVGPGLTTATGRTGLLPAGAPGTPATSPSPSHSSSAAASARSTTTPAEHHKLPKEGTDKPLAGLSGKLLPHGDQLSHGMLYRGAFTYDYQKTWTTSREDGYNAGVPVTDLIGAEQTADAPSVAQTNAAYGMVSSVTDMASVEAADTSPSFRSLTSTIVRFRTPAFASSAIAKAQGSKSGLYWVWTHLTTPNVAWSGVPGVTGDHGVYDLRSADPNPGFVAYQVVGSYIVSANSQTKATAEQGVTDMVANLKTAGLQK